MPNEQKKCCPSCNFKGIAHDTPNITYFGEEYCGKPDCKCHTPTEEVCWCGNGFGPCPTHTPTEEKIEYTKIAEGTPFEITQIKPTPTVGDDPMRFATGTGLGEIRTDGTTPTVSKWEEIEKIDIEELGKYVHEYRDGKPFTSSIDPILASRQVAEKVNEIIDSHSSKIDEVIGMIDGKDNPFLEGLDGYYDGFEKARRLFSSSLKQKLEAKRKEI